MEALSSLAGMEVPIMCSDSIKWFNVSVSSTSAPPSLELYAPPTEDASSFCKIGDPPTYFIWRINKTSPNLLEIVEFRSFTEFSRVGLRIAFTSALCPFALICKNEFPIASRNPYMLYTMTVCGVAYLIRPDNIKYYELYSVFPPNEVAELNTQSYGAHGAITAIAAAAGFLAIGHLDGSFACFRLGFLDSRSPGFVLDFRADSIPDCLSWMITRIPTPTTSVKDLLCLDIRGRTHLLVLHMNGVLQVWDLISGSRFYNQLVNGAMPEGSTFLRLWSGEFNNELSMLPLALLHKPDPKEVNGEMMSLYALHFCKVGRLNCGIWPSERDISVEEAGALIDVKLSSDKIWILKKDRLVMHNLSGPSETGEYMHITVSEHEQCFGLQKSVVAEQLFQSSEHAADDLFRLVHSLHPYAQGTSKSPLSLLYSGKTFCSRYLGYWCHENAPCGLFIDSSTGTIGLIRKSSISLLRRVKAIEVLCFGSFDDLGEIASQRINLSSNLEREVLVEVLRCTSNLSQELGKAAPALFYESFLSEPLKSSENIVERLLKVTEFKYTSSTATLYVTESGVGTVLEKTIGNHKMLKEFSTNMLLSLHGLCQKAGTWDKVFDVILKYLKFLVPHKDENKSDWKAMLESAVDILLLLNYMVKLGGQIYLLHDDVSRVQLELFPLIQEIIKEWHMIHLFGTAPCESPAMEDFSSQISPLQIVGVSLHDIIHLTWQIGLVSLGNGPKLLYSVNSNRTRLFGPKNFYDDP